MQTLPEQPRQNLIKWGLVVLIAVTILGIAVLAAVPPVSRDALTHHLAVPKLYLEKGGIVEIPDCPFSYYPMNLDLFYLLSLYWGSDILPKYIHFAFGLFTGLLIFFFLKRRIGPIYGLLGFLLFITTPVIMKLSITVYVDLGLIFFTTASLLGFIRWLEFGFKWRDLIISAGCCGLALGTKYNGLIAFFLLALFTPFAYSAKNRATRGASGRAVVQGGVFVLVALIVFSPWMIRNVVWKGNPLHPLYQSAFPANTPVSIDTKPEHGPSPTPLNHFSIRALAYGDSPLEIALIPVRVFFQGRDNSPRYFDGVLTPYLLILPLVWLLLSRRRALDPKHGEFYLLAFAVSYLLFVFVQIDMRIRWIAPIIPPLIILSVLGIDTACRHMATRLQGVGSKLGFGLVVLFLAVTLGMHYRYMVALFDKVAPGPYVFGHVSREAYITRHRPAYAVHTFANRHLSEKALILGLFLGERRYYSNRQLMMNDGLFREAANRGKTAEGMADMLKRKGFTHLMIRQDLFIKWVQDNFAAHQLENIQGFLNKHLVLLTSNGGYHLYALN